MYNYANSISMSLNDLTRMVAINFTQDTPMLDNNNDFMSDTETSEVVSSVILDENAAMNLIYGLINIYGLASDEDDTTKEED